MPLMNNNKLAIDGHVFFFKQKTAYEMHINDWSSDVCSSDLFNPKLNIAAFGKNGFHNNGADVILVLLKGLLNLPEGKLFFFQQSFVSLICVGKFNAGCGYPWPVETGVPFCFVR